MLIFYALATQLLHFAPFFTITDQCYCHISAYFGLWKSIRTLDNSPKIEFWAVLADSGTRRSDFFSSRQTVFFGAKKHGKWRQFKKMCFFCKGSLAGNQTKSFAIFGMAMDTLSICSCKSILNWLFKIHSFFLLLGVQQKLGSYCFCHGHFYFFFLICVFLLFPVNSEINLYHRSSPYLV